VDRAPGSRPGAHVRNALLYNLEGELAADAGAVDIDRAAVRRGGSDVTLITYGGSLGKTLQAAEMLAQEGVQAEVIDLRTLRPLERCHDHGVGGKDASRGDRRRGLEKRQPRGGIMARIMEQAFYELDAPVARVCSAEVPVPYAKHLEDAALPQVPAIVEAAKKVARSHA